MFKAMGILLIGFISITAFSADKNEKHNIKSVEISELSDFEQNYYQMNLADQYQFIGPEQYRGMNLIGTVDKIVTIGKTVWKIIEKNRPVVNLKLDHVSVVPEGAMHVGMLANWSMPEVKTYKVVYKNGFGIKVVEFFFRTVFTHSGTFNGKGAYIANAAIYPAHLEVLWGYTFNANTMVPKAVNIGTSENPNIALEMHLNWLVDTPFKNSQETFSIIMTGDGRTKVYQ